jgi:hypothetical protein
VLLQSIPDGNPPLGKNAAPEPRGESFAVLVLNQASRNQRGLPSSTLLRKQLFYSTTHRQAEEKAAIYQLLSYKLGKT